MVIVIKTYQRVVTVRKKAMLDIIGLLYNYYSISAAYEPVSMDQPVIVLGSDVRVIQ